MPKSSRTTSGARPNDGSSSSISRGAQHQRARHREHLLLAAGERAGLLAAPLVEAREVAVHALEVRVDRAAVLARVGAEPQVLLDA